MCLASFFNVPGQFLAFRLGVIGWDSSVRRRFDEYWK